MTDYAHYQKKDVNTAFMLCMIYWLRKHKFKKEIYLHKVLKIRTKNNKKYSIFNFKKVSISYTAQEESDHPPRPLKGERVLWCSWLQQRKQPFIQ